MKQSDIHDDPARHGVVYGGVTVTVDPMDRSAVMRIRQKGKPDARKRFDGLGELHGAAVAQKLNKEKTPEDRDFTAACNFAITTIEAGL